MKRQKGTTLNCFSPPIMLITLIVEFGLAAYAIWRYKLNTATRLIIALLVCLATFQLAEYFVCTGNAGHQLEWSRLGFVAISALPPLGLHLMHVLAGKQNRSLILTAYATMVAFMAFFIFSDAFTGNKCTGNYVIFQFTERVTGTYSIYYYGWILASLWLGIKWVEKFKSMGDKGLNTVRTIRGLIFGYLIFIIPAVTVNLVSPTSRQGIPSIMCGFAILLALTLALYILPKVSLRRKS